VEWDGMGWYMLLKHGSGGAVVAAKRRLTMYLHAYFVVLFK
jgi:hypothetical protein